MSVLFLNRKDIVNTTLQNRITAHAQWGSKRNIQLLGNDASQVKFILSQHLKCAKANETTRLKFVQLFWLK